MRVCCLGFTHSPSPPARLSALAYFLGPFATTVFGFRFNSHPFPFFSWHLSPFPTPQLPELSWPRSFVDFATLDQAQWSIPAGLCCWLCWAQSYWEACVPLCGPRGSGEGYSRNEKTSGPILSLCSPTTRTWSWVRTWLFDLPVSFHSNAFKSLACIRAIPGPLDDWRVASWSFRWLERCELLLTTIWFTHWTRAGHKLFDLSQYYFSGIIYILVWY